MDDRSVKVGGSQYITTLDGYSFHLKCTGGLRKGCKFNVLLEWETGEMISDPLFILASDDPVTCATYVKKNDLARKGSEILQKGIKP